MPEASNLLLNSAPLDLDKNLTWEKNHTLITKALAKLIRQNERMPCKAELADETGLSRQTVHKHIEQFAQEDLILEELEQFKFMSSKVLAKLMELAMDGDVKAARLSLEVMGLLKNTREHHNETTDMSERKVMM